MEYVHLFCFFNGMNESKNKRQKYKQVQQLVEKDSEGKREIGSSEESGVNTEERLKRCKLEI